METLEQLPPSELSPTVDGTGSDQEALFREAKRRERLRRLGWLAALIAVVAAGVVAVAVTQGGSTSGGAGSSAGAAAGGVTGHGTPLALPAKSTVVLLVDTSGSMAASDIKPTRIDAAIAALQDFVGRLPSSTRVGLITLSTVPSVVVDPTTDRATVLGALADIESSGATALGDGLDAAVNLAVGSLESQGITRDPGRPRPAAVILESDGQQNRGALTPRRAADLAKAAGIRIDAIALGTSSGELRFPPGFGGVIRTGDTATIIRVPPDPQAVRMISNVTGGESFNARDAAGLDAIYRHIASGIG